MPTGVSWPRFVEVLVREQTPVVVTFKKGAVERGVLSGIRRVAAGQCPQFPHQCRELYQIKVPSGGWRCLAGVEKIESGVDPVKMASQFETAFTEVTTLFDLAKEQIDALCKAALDLPGPVDE